MRLPEALSVIFDDSARVTRRKWSNPAVYCGPEQGQLCIWGNPADNLWHPWTITEEDYFADDWEILDA